MGLIQVNVPAAELITERLKGMLCYREDTLCLSEEWVCCLLAAGLTRYARWAVFLDVFLTRYTIKHGLSDPCHISKEVPFRSGGGITLALKMQKITAFFQPEMN